MDTKLCNECGRELPTGQFAGRIRVHPFTGTKRYFLRASCRDCRHERSVLETKRFDAGRRYADQILGDMSEEDLQGVGDNVFIDP